MSTLLIVALPVRLSGPGNVLFFQERIGINGQRFHMIKFRSMAADAEARLAARQDTQHDVQQLVEARGARNEPSRHTRGGMSGSIRKSKNPAV